MDKESIQFVLDALPKGRTVFHSFPDHYAVQCLSRLVGDAGMTVAELKRSCFAPMLNRPAIKAVCSQAGDGRLTADSFAEAWPARPDAYRLTLSTWPGLDEKPDPNWHQITRPGWTLVLQLNFTVSHNRRLKCLVKDWEYPIRYNCHPIAGDGEITLAWARVDLSLDTSEALIEEVQSDWVRDALWLAGLGDEEAGEWETYVEKELQPRLKTWGETMLTATIWFLAEEIGIKTIFYHTFETGARLKHLEESLPPRSIYTQLPKKFCFRKTHNGPLFLRDCAGKKFARSLTDPTTTWFVMVS
jgi:hypothetical protein